MKFIRKTNKLFKVEEEKEVDGVEVWMLTWKAYRCSYDDCDTLVNNSINSKAFFNKEDAELFAQSLKDANELLQNKTNLRINITKQK